MNKGRNSKGQAMIEYILVLGLLSFVGMKTVRFFSKFMAESMGNLASVISTHLTVGVCGKTGNKGCFFYGYKNGFEN